MSMFRRALILLLAPASAGLAGCAQFPALEGTVAPAVSQAPYMALLPFESFPAMPPPATDLAAALLAAGADLNSRAQDQQQSQP